MYMATMDSVKDDVELNAVYTAYSKEVTVRGAKSPLSFFFSFLFLKSLVYLSKRKPLITCILRKQPLYLHINLIINL